MSYIVDLEMNNKFIRYTIEEEFRALFRYLPETQAWYSGNKFRIKHGNKILFYILPGGEILVK